MVELKFAVIGFPITHSLSPFIHNPAFEHCGIDALYTKLQITPEALDKTLQALKREKAWRGFNVTVPHKQAVIEHLDSLDPLAAKVAAVNTIDIKNGKWLGHNTDCHGFLVPLRKDIQTIKNVLLIGAGGAARAAGFALLQEAAGLIELRIANRTWERAQELADDLKKHTKALVALAAEYGGWQPDLIVNTTSVGMGQNTAGTPFDFKDGFHSGTIAYDLIYNPSETVFLKRARHKGLKAINGMAMLAGQGMKSFEIWTGEGYPFTLEETIERLNRALKKA